MSSWGIVEVAYALVIVAAFWKLRRIGQEHERALKVIRDRCEAGMRQAEAEYLRKLGMHVRPVPDASVDAREAR